MFVAQQTLPVSPFFPSFFLFFIFHISFLKASFILLCKAMRRASVRFSFVYPRIISNARKQKNGNTIDEHCSSNLKRKRRYFFIPFAFCLANLREYVARICLYVKKRKKKDNALIKSCSLECIVLLSMKLIFVGHFARHFSRNIG